MDFSKVKSITIPEGSVKSIACNGVTLWNKPFKCVAGQLTCPSGNAFNCYTEGDAEWRFKVTVKLSQFGRYIAKNFYASSPARGWGVYINAAGTYPEGSISLVGSAYANITWDDLTLTKDEWHTIEIYGKTTNASTGQGTFYASIDGGDFVEKSAVICSASQYLGAIALGDSAVSFRDEIVIKGTPYSPSSTQNSMTINIEDATVGSALNLSNNGYTVTSTTLVTEERE